MRKVAVSVFLLMSISYFIFGAGSIEKGNNTLKRDISSFEKIYVEHVGCKINYYSSDEYRASVTIDSNLQEYISVITNNNTLKISVKSSK